jgi:hypothetical protein
LALKNYLNINILTEMETQPGNSDGCHIAPQHNVVHSEDSESFPRRFHDGACEKHRLGCGSLVQTHRSEK